MTQQMLTNDDKIVIKTKLDAYVKRYGSQSKAANSLKGVSLGTINAILNGNFENISDQMFRKIQAQIESQKMDGWQFCSTAAYQDICTFLEDAQRYQNVSWIVGSAGIGKTTAANLYSESHRNVFVLPCSEDMHKYDFISELAMKIGIRTDGMTRRQKLNAITTELVKIERPLLIFDEADKLRDTVMYYYINLYNALEDKCGMVFLSTPHIKRRMERGLRLDKKGYDELHSRICRKFIDISPVTDYEVVALCRHNGLTEDKDINAVLKDTKTANFDLRRVKKAIHKQKRISASEKL